MIKQRMHEFQMFSDEKYFLIHNVRGHRKYQHNRHTRKQLEKNCHIYFAVQFVTSLNLLRVLRFNIGDKQKFEKQNAHTAIVDESMTFFQKYFFHV